MTAHTSPSGALDDAFAAYILAVTGNRPRPLRALNSPAALRMRAAEVEHTILAFELYLQALLADTAQNLWLDRDLTLEVNAHCQDLASDVRGALNDAITERAA